MDKKAPITEEVGFVTSIDKYLLTLQGLPNIKINEMIASENHARAIVTSIYQNEIEALLLDDVVVKPKEIFKRTGQQLSIKAGTHLLGRAINPVGIPIDGKAGFASQGKMVPSQQGVPSIKHRDFIKEQFVTGATLVDILTPLAKGQRELIIGDANSGKNEFLIDTLVNQRGKKNFICVYGLIGKPINEVKAVIDTVTTNQALAYTTFVATSSSEQAPLIFLTPYVAMALAEYFQSQGNDVLLILDDMGIHAKFYREISLLSKKPPGRDSYPGDIFFQQARLIERAGKFNQASGGGSITALPVIQTHLDDFISFMTTNLMGMTDGHLLFSSSRFKTGIRPSIDVSLSVSRVGRQTQNIVEKLLSDRIKTIMAEGIKLENYSKFGSELSNQTRFTLKQSRQIQELLKQSQLQNIPLIVQMILLGLIFTPLFTTKDENFIQLNKNKIIEYLVTKKDLTLFTKEVIALQDDKQFIQSLEKLMPELEQLCAQPQKGVSPHA